jgi:phytoene dehydrogenase-like protein
VHDYDAIVIGSGSGGMTAALALARTGRRVGVFEQHTLLGGYSQTFELRGFRFSPGVHYIGDLEPGGGLRSIYEGLGVADELEFFELNPDAFEHIVIGDERFDMPKGFGPLCERLSARFPTQAAGIRAYFDVVTRMGEELQWASPQTWRDKLTLPLRMPTTLRHGLLPLDRFLDQFTREPLLRAILSIQSGNHGMPPTRAPAIVHASMLTYYMNGGCYPRGGGGSIPAAFARALREHGGEVHVGREVVRVLVEGGRAIGVELRDGTQVRAHAVVSNTDPSVLWGELVPPAYVSRRVARKLARMRYSICTASLFLATDLDLRALGLDSGNVWYSRTPNIDATYGIGHDISTGPIAGMFFSVTTLKDPSLRRDGVHTMEVLTSASWDAFSRWQDSKTGRRPRTYKLEKLRIRERMLDALERFIPGLREHLVYSSTATPLTNAFYVKATHGAIYGPENSLRNSGPWRFPIVSELPGLYQCGSSTLAPGIAGVTRSGLAAAAAVVGCQPHELLSATGQQLRISSAEDPRSWPADLRPQEGADLQALR